MQLRTPFSDLAAWISEKWAITVLNVIYDRRNDLHAPRIQVILERSNELQSFRDGYNFDKKKQNAVALQFLEIISRQTDHDYDVEGLFVIFSAFSPLARQEADSKISEKEIESLKHRINNPEIWEISRFFGHVTFMFYTNAQVDKYTAKGIKTKYKSMYLELLRPYDEFGYLSEDNFAINFDSKQNFEENYKGNWFYYYK